MAAFDTDETRWTSNILNGIDLTPTPATQPKVTHPVSTNTCSSGERYRSIGFDAVPDFISGNYFEKRTELTRKFSREAEILLIRGMLKHGKTKSWKKMCVLHVLNVRANVIQTSQVVLRGFRAQRSNEQPGLHHIQHSALKDRARSRRFQRILARAELDPSLLDRPDELCGKPGTSLSRYTDDKPAGSSKWKPNEIRVEPEVLLGHAEFNATRGTTIPFLK
jgi:hypothetical protein